MKVSKEIHQKARDILGNRSRLRDCYDAGICPSCGGRLKGVDAIEDRVSTKYMKCISCRFRVTMREFFYEIGRKEGDD